MNRIENFLKRIELDAEVELNLDFLGKVQSHAVTAIAYENLDIVHTKLARDRRRNDVTIGKLYFKDRVGQCFNYLTIFEFYHIILSQNVFLHLTDIRIGKY